MLGTYYAVQKMLLKVSGKSSIVLTVSQNQPVQCRAGGEKKQDDETCQIGYCRSNRREI